MNCKLGDLAVIVQGGTNDGNANVGRLVDVVEAWGDGETWIVRAVGGPFARIPLSRDQHLLGVFDSKLRPIRDPGDDAVDESARWLPPVPLPTINPETVS